MQYTSWSTAFDTYKGTLNWQDLSLQQRVTIAQSTLSNTKDDFDIKDFVMGTNLRRAQYDGLTSIIAWSAVTLHSDENPDIKVDYSIVLPHLLGTAIGEELSSLLAGTAQEETPYRMGELEFFAYSPMRDNPLDRLIDLPKDIRLEALRSLLKPKRAFFPSSKVSRRPSNPNDLSYQEAINLIQSKSLRAYASYAGSLNVFAYGLIKPDFIGRITNIGFLGSPISGLIAAFFVAWWWFPLGLICSVVFFRISRRRASQAVLKKALTDEEFFDKMKKNMTIYLEYTP